MTSFARSAANGFAVEQPMLPLASVTMLHSEDVQLPDS
jgi:hypothetical protein